ncbi:serine/threonine-protein kinase [Thermosynechococcaceae cyanobacterium BACA0444]|uniref:Serine/threonine-protein kinase B n=1 Tax=Pseudocalidococcus azoricus BACA0444 TaxID=2918990 RepID=A0AAE4JX72_9CYAN|nr:serine/threonine-protein kinase [Pseudocalidococcus azoricus]MDS3862215.1 serine/threonine-protein kinase [Pseudocalidococcus azoricus BACA0444]
MSYCYNPACTNPANPDDATLCQACGTNLLLHNRYRCTKILGRGGFGTTFLADDMVLPGKPNCVIKQLRPAASAPHILDMARQLFQREATTLGKVGNHPQVPRLLDYFELEPEFYLVQEYVSGLTLQQEVKRNGPMSEGQVRQVMLEVLPILDYLHKIEVIHRDIKPANLIRREIDGKLILIDFGAVKDQVSQAMMANPQDYTAFTAFAVGTPGYAPPEQMAMRPVYASDIYALGVTCIYLLTGKSPKDLGYDNTTGEFIWRSRVNISNDLQNVLEKMTEVSIKHRYQTAQDVLQDLQLVQKRLDLQQFSSPSSVGSDINQGLATGPLHSRPDPSSRSTGSLPTTVSPATRHAANAARSQQARAGLQPNYSRFAPPSTRVPARTSGAAQTPPSQVSYDNNPHGGSRLTPQTLMAAYNRGERDFSESRLDNLVLRKANLSDARFVQAFLQKADLRGCVMMNVDFGRANLGGANLRDCDLRASYFVNADLQGANLQGANLREASLTNANLRGANLQNADLTGSNITPNQIAQARTNWFTIHPNGKRGIGI